MNAHICNFPHSHCSLIMISHPPKNHQENLQRHRQINHTAVFILDLFYNWKCNCLLSVCKTGPNRDVTIKYSTEEFQNELEGCTVVEGSLVISMGLEAKSAEFQVRTLTHIFIWGSKGIKYQRGLVGKKIIDLAEGQVTDPSQGKTLFSFLPVNDLGPLKVF